MGATGWAATIVAKLRAIITSVWHADTFAISRECAADHSATRLLCAAIAWRLATSSARVRTRRRKGRGSDAAVRGDD